MLLLAGGQLKMLTRCPSIENVVPYSNHTCHPNLRIPVVSCYIDDVKIERVMCDLGASISLMPYSLCKKFNMGEPKPTQMILRLADRSSRFPKGVLKDVPVRVGNFYIPGDFVVLEMEEDNEIPILLGRPFLYTAGAIFDTT
ncbi:unnamed protein product [Rhodiola kirilowii]